MKYLYLSFLCMAGIILQSLNSSLFMRTSNNTAHFRADSSPVIPWFHFGNQRFLCRGLSIKGELMQFSIQFRIEITELKLVSLYLCIDKTSHCRALYVGVKWHSLLCFMRESAVTHHAVHCTLECSNTDCGVLWLWEQVYKFDHALFNYYMLQYKVRIETRC